VVGWALTRARAANEKRAKTSHSPSFRSASVHFLLTASLHGRTYLPVSVRKLLDADLAISAAWPSESAIRVSYRLRKEARRIRKIRAIATIHARGENTASWRVALQFAVRFPRLGSLYLRGKWLSTVVLPRLEAFASSPSARSLFVLFAFHPLFTVLKVLPTIRITFSGDVKDAPPVEQDEIGGGAPDVEIEDDGSDVLGMLAEAEEIYLKRQVVSAAIRINDAHLFGGPDREQDGFVRLMLRESYHDFILPGSDTEHHVVFEPRLLIHDSGIVQIDLVLSAETALDVRQALAMMWGPERIFVSSRMSTPLIRGTPWEGLADYSAGEIDAGYPLGTIVHESPASMSDLLHIHLEAVLAIIKRAHRHWVIYPVAIVDVDECCTPEGWRQAHRDDLIRLAMRGSIERAIAPHVPAPRDLSLGRDRSLYAGLGSAVLLQWRGAAPRGIAELDTALVLEYALLQYMRVHTIEENVSRMALGERSLRSRYREAIRIFSELRQRDLRSGETREIVRHVLADLGVPEMRRTIESALNLAASAYATLSAERASRRTWWVTSGATLIALLVAVPPLRELLDSVPAARTYEPWALAPLRLLSAQGFWGPWITMAGVLLFVVILWFVTALWRSRPRRLPSFRKGFKWPTEFAADQDIYSPTSSGPRIVNLQTNLLSDADTDGLS
jgi:hypothetical protein